MAARKKKMAAALAAVTLYLQDEEAMNSKEILNPSVTIEPTAWGQSGRQEMMTMRRLVQMRTFTR